MIHRNLPVTVCQQFLSMRTQTHWVALELASEISGNRVLEAGVWEGHDLYPRGLWLYDQPGECIPGGWNQNLTNKISRPSKIYYLFLSNELRKPWTIFSLKNGVTFRRGQIPVSVFLKPQFGANGHVSPILTCFTWCPKRRLWLQLQLNQHVCQCWRIGRRARSSRSCSRSRHFRTQPKIES